MSDSPGLRDAIVHQRLMLSPLDEKASASASLPALYEALKNPSLSDARHREPLLEAAMNQVGADTVA